MIPSVIIIGKGMFVVENPEPSCRPMSCSLTGSPAVLTLRREVLLAHAFGREPIETAFVLVRATDLWGMLEYRGDQEDIF